MLEFPLTDIFENRDYAGCNHFFFDIGNGNLLAFFDFPGSTSVRTPRCWAVSTTSRMLVEPDRWSAWWASSPKRVEHEVISGSSVYFHDPDGTRLELIKDPLGEMYGSTGLLTHTDRGDGAKRRSSQRSERPRRRYPAPQRASQ